MNIIEQFQALVSQRRFSEALPLIREIVQRSPRIATSHFNLGVCLDGLGQHQEASRAFLRAYELKPEDGGALFRACLTLAKGDDTGGLLAIFQRECTRDPEMIQLFLETPEFARFFELPEFKSLRDKFAV